MKGFFNSIFIMCLLGLLCCGGKNSNGKTNAAITLTNNFIIAGQTGGVLLFGQNLALGKEFTTEVSDNQVITLENGSWNFLAISWDGANKMTGTNRCAFSLGTEISASNSAVSLSLSEANCLVAGSLQQEVFGDIFQTATTTAFKTLQINTCDQLSQSGVGCDTTGTPPLTGSVEVIIPLDIITASSPTELASSCESVSTITVDWYQAATTIQLPAYTTIDGPTKPIIALHTSADCSDTDPVEYKLPNGLMPHADQQNGNFTLVSDLDNSFPNDIRLYLEHNSITSSAAQPLVFVSSDLPALAADYSTITSVDVEITDLYDNDVVKIYFNDATCTDETNGLVGSTNVGVSPLDLNTVTLAYATVLSGSGGNHSYHVKVLTSGGVAHPFTGSVDCQLVDTVTDPTAPIAPSSASATWLESTPYNATGINASWIVSASADVLSQRVDVYTDGACSALDTSFPIANNVTSSQAFTGVDSLTYYFTVTAIDVAGNETSTACSTGVEIDTTFPASPISLNWAEASPYNSSAVNAQWTVSASPDVASQFVTYYSDASCISPEGTTTNLGSGTSSDFFPSGADGMSYTYDIQVTDFAGNSMTSACSTVMQIDTTAPVAPVLTAGTKNGWVEAANVTFPTSANSSWALSASGDIASQRVDYYIGAGCGGAAHTTHNISSVATTDNFAGASATTFSVEVTAIDFAGNETTSACSDPMTFL